VNGPHEVRYADRATLATALASSIATNLNYAIEARGTAGLVVSGGSTPMPLFQDLARKDIPWENVVVTLADERWVPADHEDSNERLVRTQLLTANAAAARFVGLFNEAATPEEGCAATERALVDLPHPIDVLVLGMGGDGHTASLFRGAHELAAALDLENPHRCLAVRPHAAPHPRLSLSLKALLASRRIVLHITGEEKWEVYRQALAEGPVEELPIRAVLRNAEPAVEVIWAP
jgi:6-phosphogluconolactonase